MTFGLFLEWFIKSLVVILATTLGFAYLTWFERRVLARFQVRIGPNRVGKEGLLQPVADALKLIFKEELVPANADKLIFILAPVITMIPALIITGVVPWGPPIVLFGKPFTLSVSDINLELLFIFTVTSISVYGITRAGGLPITNMQHWAVCVPQPR
jgi:NADH-quinone oxidoreductase subunit H